MSRQERLKKSAVSATRGAQDVHLHIDLRLDAEDLTKMSVASAREPLTQDKLCKLACRMFNARRLRDRLLDDDLFGEPAWDMLLALYCALGTGERLSITSLSFAANVPQTSGLRWQAVLEDRRLIERRQDMRDGRRQIVQLTRKGRDLLENYFKRLYHSDISAPPPLNPGGA